MLKKGNEKFKFQNSNLHFSLVDFWSWAQSDLLSNTLRGILAEYIVKQDLGITSPFRTEWNAYDLETSEGIKIEIKSAAYLQNWLQIKPSTISFDIAPKKGWNSSTNQLSKEKKRYADFYIFCLLNETDKSTVDPMNLNQWIFYVLNTKVLDQEKSTQKKISLNSLLKLNPIICKYGEIRKHIEPVF